MKKSLSGKRRFLILLLALAGIAITVAYMFCLGSCSNLKGDILGIDLKYLGVFYMAVIFVLAWLRKSLLCLLLLAFGAGGEIFLIGYQVHHDVYCRYCLAFGATIFLALAVNFERKRKAIAALAAAAGLLFFLLFFSGATMSLYAAEPPVMPTFGKGAHEIRLYTDYFCEPCAAEEAEVISIITELVDKNLVRVIFIDVPGNPETILYVDYFLAALNAKRDLRQAVAARGALFEAARKEIQGREALETFLKMKKMDILPYDTAPVMKLYNNYLKEDRISGTPTCVIIGPKGKQNLQGASKVMKGLRDLGK